MVVIAAMPVFRRSTAVIAAREEGGDRKDDHSDARANRATPVHSWFSARFHVPIVETVERGTRALMPIGKQSRRQPLWRPTAKRDLDISSGPRNLGGPRAAAALHAFEGDGLGGLRSGDRIGRAVSIGRTGRALAGDPYGDTCGGVRAQVRSQIGRLRAKLRQPCPACLAAAAPSRRVPSR